MKHYYLLFVFVVIFNNVNGEDKVDKSRQWPSYRGQNASGILDDANLPEKWDLETGENIRWQVDIPGMGLGSPVVWGDKVFVTSAISTDDKDALEPGIFGSIEPVDDESIHEWKLYCFRKRDGKLLWENTCYKGIPAQKRHPKSTHANTTVATNGKIVVAFFGSQGLHCFAMDGEKRWSQSFKPMKSSFFRVPEAEWEFSSSPIIYNEIIVVQCDVLENSFVRAYNGLSGKVIWERDRDEYPGWSTPSIYFDDDKPRVALNGFKHRGAYDLLSGEEIWKMSGGGDIPVPAPIVANNMIYFNSAHGKESPIFAISTKAKGNLSAIKGKYINQFINWHKVRGGSYMGTMLVYGDYLYNAKWNGSLVCYNAKTGEKIYQKKVGSGNSYTSSPVASDGKIYIADDHGEVYTIKAGSDFQLLSSSSLGDVFMSTPALSDGMLLFRTQSKLIVVGK